MSPLPHKNRSLRFSECCDIHIIQPQGQWYTPEDILFFRRQLIIDINLLRRMATVAPYEVFTEDEKYMCIGIEMFLDRAITMEIAAKRSLHIRGILRVQSCHQGNWCCQYLEELSRVSKETSHWACETARARATAYLNL